MTLLAEVTLLSAARPLSGVKARELVAPVIAGTLTMLASITLIVVSAWLITRAWEMPPVMDLTVAVTAVRALGISRAAFRYVERLVSHDLALRSAGRARSNAYEVLASEPVRTLEMGRGAMLTRLGSDIDSVADVIVRAVVPAGVAMLTGIIAVGFTALLSVPVAAVLLLGLVLAATIPSERAARGVRIAEAARATAVEAYTSAVDRVLSDSATLRVHGEMDKALSAADSSARDDASASESGSSASAVGAASSLWIHGFTVCGVVAVAATLYAAEGVAVHSPQWLAVVVLLSLAAFEAVSLLPDAAIAVTRASGAAKRLSSLGNADQHTETERVACPERPTIDARNLVYGWDRNLGVCDLLVPFGARHHIIAPSGSGKTTLLLTLAGLLPARGGSVRVGGIDPTTLSDGITLSLEDAHVFATTVRDNLAIGASSATDEDMILVLSAVGLSEWVEGLTNGLGTVLTSGSASLSGGQRRRLLLARALLTDSPILLLDEPTEHLDAAGTAEVLALLARDELPGRRARRTVIVVRHPR